MLTKWWMVNGKNGKWLMVTKWWMVNDNKTINGKRILSCKW